MKHHQSDQPSPYLLDAKLALYFLYCWRPRLACCVTSQYMSAASITSGLMSTGMAHGRRLHVGIGLTDARIMYKTARQAAPFVAEVSAPTF